MTLACVPFLYTFPFKQLSFHHILLGWILFHPFLVCFHTWCQHLFLYSLLSLTLSSSSLLLTKQSSHELSRKRLSPSISLGYRPNFKTNFFYLATSQFLSFFSTTTLPFSSFFANLMHTSSANASHPWASLLLNAYIKLEWLPNISAF